MPSQTETEPEFTWSLLVKVSHRQERLNFWFINKHSYLPAAVNEVWQKSLDDASLCEQALALKVKLIERLSISNTSQTDKHYSTSNLRTYDAKKNESYVTEWVLKFR